MISPLRFTYLTFVTNGPISPRLVPAFITIAPPKDAGTPVKDSQPLSPNFAAIALRELSLTLAGKEYSLCSLSCSSLSKGNRKAK